jgi:hypothetical protein
MATKYKVWIEIERIDIDDEGNEEYSECDCPASVRTLDTFQEAVVLQELIVDSFI